MTAPRDPLFDTLFRSTAAMPSIASAAPVREAGTRSRAGNAMSRTRVALLDGARRAVEVSGTKITMAQVAAAAGVAKATLYNHFRTREAVLAALLEDEVTALVAQLRDQPLAEALGAAANALAQHPLLHTLARLEPATLTRIGRIDIAKPGWRAARAGVAEALARDGRGGADTVLRWLASYVVTPATELAVTQDLAVVLAGLPGAPAGVSAAAPVSSPDGTAARSA
ncbi:MAG: TetR family transcriptional regulator [Jatrophihabitantaceae bacterium]